MEPSNKTVKHKNSNDGQQLSHENQLSLLERHGAEKGVIEAVPLSVKPKRSDENQKIKSDTSVKSPRSPNKNIMFLEDIQEALDEEIVDNYHVSLLEKANIYYKIDDMPKNVLKDKNDGVCTEKVSKLTNIDKENIVIDAAVPRVTLEKRPTDRKLQTLNPDLTSDSLLPTRQSFTVNDTNNDTKNKTKSGGKEELKVTKGIPVPVSVKSQEDECSLNVVNKSTEKSSRYVLIRTIGRGNFAKVKLAKHLATNKIVAIKIIDKTKLSTKILTKITREVSLMKELSHPNIVKLLEVMENENTLYLVMEYASGGELFDYLVANGCMKEKDARIKFREMISAVQYIHSKSIVHRDLKAENMLLNHKMEIKIADFGFANKFDPSSTLSTFCGSPPYAAPEIFQGKQYIGPEVDVWALGVILFTLVSGRLPFDGINVADLRNKVINLRYELPYFISFECENLLKKMLVVNVTDRITIDEIMKDEWVNGGGLSKLKCYKDKEFVICQRRMTILKEMGFNELDIKETFKEKKFNIIHATYILLNQSKAEDNTFYQNSLRNSMSATDTITKTNIKSAIPDFTAIPEMIPQRPVAQSLTGNTATTLAQYFRSWFYKKPETSESYKARESQQMDTLSGVTSKEFMKQYNQAVSNMTNDQITDPNTSVPRGANQQAILATINQMSISKHQKAGMFVSNTIGTPTHKQIMENNQMSAPPSYLMSPRMSSKQNNEAVSLGKFTVQEVKNPQNHRVMSIKSDEDSILIVASKKSKGKSKKNDETNSVRDKTKKKTAPSNDTVSDILMKISDPAWVKFDKKTKPSVANFAFSMNTVSSMHADHILVEVIRVLKENSFSYEFLEKYLLLCHLADKQIEEYGDSIQWEVEVCRVPALFMNGVRLKRIFGSTFAYKKIGSIITKSLKL